MFRTPLLRDLPPLELGPLVGAVGGQAYYYGEQLLMKGQSAGSSIPGARYRALAR